jgi:UDP-N-acetylmuramate--alanine ligase
MGKDLQLQPDGVAFALEAEGERHDVRLQVPGRHNASNALAGIAASRALGVRLEDAVSALARFEGLRRRLELVGKAAGITVIDDFAHNPDKIEATLATLRAHPGRLLLMFQPHGFGPLSKMGEELAHSFADGMAPDDRLYLPDPVYQGGTVERTHGSDWLAEQVNGRERHARHIPDRPKISEALLAEAREGDRIVIMGARDDTLIDFARELVERLESRN